MKTTFKHKHFSRSWFKPSIGFVMSENDFLKNIFRKSINITSCYGRYSYLNIRSY